jgi:hypothetical protein
VLGVRGGCTNLLGVLGVLVAALVLSKGGDALSVCFNTVAVLFLCEIDNLVYAIGMGEKLRARVETDGRVELGEGEANALMLSKLQHVCVLVLAVPCGVWVGGNGGNYSVSVVGRYLPIFAFWLAGAMEAIADADGAARACKKVAKVTGRWLLGSGGFFVLYLASFL